MQYIILKPQNSNSKHNLIIGTYFHCQNVEKHKKDKIVTLFFQICQILSSQGARRNSEFLKLSLQYYFLRQIDNRKGAF